MTTMFVSNINLLCVWFPRHDGKEYRDTAIVPARVFRQFTCVPSIWLRGRGFDSVQSLSLFVSPSLSPQPTGLLAYLDSPDAVPEKDVDRMHIRDNVKIATVTCSGDDSDVPLYQLRTLLWYL